MGLTREQFVASRHEGSHAAVVAVAGSGKTRTMIERVIYLLQKGADPKRILILMFNKSAQVDFEERLERECFKHGLAKPEVLTFHACGLRVCNDLAKKGLLDKYELETRDWVLHRLIKTVFAQVNANLSPDDQFENDAQTVSDAESTIAMVKDSLILEELEEQEMLGEKKSEGGPPLPARWMAFFSMFEEMRHKAQLRFFTDLVYDPVMAMLASEETAQFVANRYDHIICDEYQDVCTVQVRFLQHLAGTRAHVMAVGDPDQCIYSWRGAKPEYMSHLFEKCFPGATRYTLSRTFRYGHTVALMANHVIRHNKNRPDTLSVSAAKVDTRLQVIQAGNDPGEAVIMSIREWLNQGRSLREVAVLVREFSHTVHTETALLRHGIDYRIVGAPPFFDRREILSLRAAMAVADNRWEQMEQDEQVLNMMTALFAVPSRYIRSDDLEAALTPLVEKREGINAGLLRYAETLLSGKSSNRKLQDLKKHLTECRNAGGNMNAGAFLNATLRRLDLYTYFSRNLDSNAASEQMHQVHQFVLQAERHGGTVREFADSIDELSLRFIEHKSSGDQVLLTSGHRAKGLEWPLVIVPELTDGRFPSIGPDTDLESERRLFYVVATRAIEKLTLVAPRDDLMRDWSAKRMAGFPEKGKMVASRFLYEANLGAAFHAGQAILQGNDPLTHAVLGDPNDVAKASVVKRYVEALADTSFSLNAEPDGNAVSEEADQGPAEMEFF